MGTVTVQDRIKCMLHLDVSEVSPRPRLLGSRGDSGRRSLEEAAREIYGEHLVRQKERSVCRSQ